MALFKCKMCGGTLEFAAGESVGLCDSCGTKQTLPRLDSERKANLYDRANHFRRNNEFDKAMGIYEQILNEDRTDAEAYWSIVLCRYGIEYVEDPPSHKRIPTVNRAQFTSIFDDEDYKAAIANANGLQQSIYEDEAKTINEIQKGILAISQREEPFDVFICYKETDNTGRRTQDSVLANDLYHQLTQEGFKVFFARITLEDKLGVAYEPYIFAALNSAKVMVVLGTKPEYFNAVWVKNEWSRYLALIKKGGNKVLIPAYRDMDPYDLPEEFSHLQAQDMSKLGFMQDLIRGIKKIAADESKKSAAPQMTIIQSEGGNIEALLDRGNMALEDGEWDKADEFFEQVLNLDSRRAEAYLGKFLASEKCENLNAYARSRAEQAKPVVVRLAACPPDTERIEAAIKQYAVSGYLGENQMRKSFVYNLDYVSELDGWEEECKHAKRYLADSKMFARAESFAQGQCKKDIEAGKQLLFTLLQERRDARKVEEDAGIADIKARYAAFLEAAEAKAAELYEEATNKRESEYAKAVITMNKAVSSSDFKMAAGLFSQLKGYRDAETLEKRCMEAANNRVKEEAVAEKKADRKAVIIAAAFFVLAIMVLGVVGAILNAI